MTNALDKYRKKFSLTYRDLAKLSGLSLYTVHRHCHCTRIPAESAVIYNRQLNIPLHELRPDLWKDGFANEPDIP